MLPSHLKREHGGDKGRELGLWIAGIFLRGVLLTEDAAAGSRGPSLRWSRARASQACAHGHARTHARTHESAADLRLDRRIEVIVCVDAPSAVAVAMRSVADAAPVFLPQSAGPSSATGRSGRGGVVRRSDSAAGAGTRGWRARTSAQTAGPARAHGPATSRSSLRWSTCAPPAGSLRRRPRSVLWPFVPVLVTVFLQKAFLARPGPSSHLEAWASRASARPWRRTSCGTPARAAAVPARACACPRACGAARHP